MATTEERLRILKMIEAGKLSADAGAKLIAALTTSREQERKSPPPPTGAAAGKGRWLRVRVSNTRTGRQLVNVSLPINLVDIGLQIGARFSPQLQGIRVNQLLQSIKDGTTGKLIDVTEANDGNHVEVFVE